MSRHAEQMLAERQRSAEGCSVRDQNNNVWKGEDHQWHRSKNTSGQRLSAASILSQVGASKSTGSTVEMGWIQQAIGAVNNIKHLLAGAMSAVLSKSCTAPLERVKMEMQLKQKANAVAVAETLLKQGGFLTFWQGNGMNLLRVTPHKAVNFYSFYLYRMGLAKALGTVDVKGVDRFIAGAMAGSTATLLCFPLDVIRTRMLSRDGAKYATAVSTVKAILQEETPSSFYVGCLPAVVSTAASGAIFYGIYDILKERYFRSQRLRHPKSELSLSAGRTMLYGALAGAAAESMLYPLEVLRRRMQLQSMQATEVLLGAQEVERMTLAAATERGAFAELGKRVPQLHRVAAAAMKKEYLQKVANAAVEIYKMDGLPGFYQGIAPHILQVLPSAALSYYFYEACKRGLKVKE